MAPIRTEKRLVYGNFHPEEAPKLHQKTPIIQEIGSKFLIRLDPDLMSALIEFGTSQNLESTSGLKRSSHQWVLLSYFQDRLKYKSQGLVSMSDTDLIQMVIGEGVDLGYCYWPNRCVDWTVQQNLPQQKILVGGCRHAAGRGLGDFHHCPSKITNCTAIFVFFYFFFA